MTEHSWYGFPVNKKYKVILADPSWKYGNWEVSKHFRWWGIAKKHYDTLDVDIIKKLPVQKIAAKNSFLFLWCTFPNLADGLEVIESWGFKYKTIGFLWTKTNKYNDKLYFGMGNYSRANAEPCLLATKGKPEVKSNNVFSIIRSSIKEHSKKPDEVRKRIVELCGDVPRIELFARTKAHGWDAWGNDDKLELEPIEKFF